MFVAACRSCGKIRTGSGSSKGTKHYKKARMAKSADAADLKSAEVYPSWGFKSPSGHQIIKELIAK